MPLARRIVFLCSRIEGGIGRNTLRLSRHFVDDNRAVEIWVSDTRNDFPDEIDRRIKVRRLKTTHGIAGVPLVLKEIIRFRPDVLITPTERLTRICLRARIFVPSKPAVVACVHNYYSKLYENLPRKKSLKRKALIAKMYPKLAAVVCVSKGVAHDIQAYSGAALPNISVIYNPIVEQGFEVRGESTLPDCYEQGSVIVNVGNICEQKNQGFLIDSFCELRKKRDCSLVIVGGGDPADLRAQVEASEFKDDIYLLGHQSNPYPFIAAAKVFALSSVYEGFGNVVVESLLCGTPVVSTASGGPEEILTQEVLGVIVKGSTKSDFAHAMGSCLDRPLQKQQLVDFAYRHYSLKQIGSEYLNLIDNL